MFVRIHYDGWLALPPITRRQLGLNTGDRLEVVPTADGVLLRRKEQPVATAPVEEPAFAAAPEPAKPVARARRAAPRAEGKARVGAVLPPTLRARGKRAANGKAGEGAPQGKG